MTETNLIERLEKAEGPCRELDVEAAFAFGWRPRMPKDRWRAGFRYRPHGNIPGAFQMWTPDGEDPCGKIKTAPKLTSSIDAAITFIPKGYRFRFLSHHNGDTYVCNLEPSSGTQHISANSAYPAIAICIAALRAMGDDDG